MFELNVGDLYLDEFDRWYVLCLERLPSGYSKIIVFSLDNNIIRIVRKSNYVITAYTHKIFFI